MTRQPPQDTIAALGELALASRLRRLADTLSEEAAELYRDLGTGFEPRWFPLLQTLAQASPQPITALARALGLTHPGTRQIAEQMLQAGLLRESRRGGDRRERLLGLTPKARRLQKSLAPVWQAIRQGVRGYLDDAGVDLLKVLGRLEEVERERSVMDRVRSSLGLPARRRLEIALYRPAYRKYYRELLSAEKPGRAADGASEAALIRDPNGLILRRGGRILFALQDGAVAGTCVLRRYRGGEWELCLVAVSAGGPAGSGVEDALAAAAVDEVRRAGCSELYFCPPRGRTALVRLGRRLGFRRAPPPAFIAPEARRSHLVLILELGPEDPGR
jgi:DNA-binding MarR family transcriptional regulator